MTNRNPLKQYFVTFPTWTSDKHQLFMELRESINPEYLELCQEHHKDGAIHYHVVTKLTKAMTQSQLLKLFKDLYPTDNKRIHVRPVRSIKHALDYIRKEDSSPLRYGEIKSPMSWRQKIAIRISNAIGNSSFECIRNDPHLKKQFIKHCNDLWVKQFPSVKNEWQEMMLGIEKYFPDHNFNFFKNFLENTDMSK